MGPIQKILITSKVSAVYSRGRDGSSLRSTIGNLNKVELSTTGNLAGYMIISDALIS